MGDERYYAWGSMNKAEAIGTFIGRALMIGTWLIGLPAFLWYVFAG